MNGAAFEKVDMCAGETMRVVDRLALRHVLEILLLEAERASSCAA